MKIGQMFLKEIQPDFNGVIQVQDEDTRTLVTELDEYVITTELKRHFMSFFNSLCASYDHPTTNVGVWISGFFGSGKSHFLKMLSYILENREVAGVKTVERFRSKFSEDPATFMMIDRATRTQNDTILFNIDREGSINKDRTAVLRVFFKMFYNHLGFYGENLKVAKLEQHVAKQGKTEEFRRVFREKNGSEWVDTRDAYAFFEDDIVDTLCEVLGMSEQAARNWFNGSENIDTSINQLAEEIKAYVDAKPKDYRLFFMVDEVGQYVGADLDLLLNLQSIVETLGSKCQGKVWIACTGQEALDEIIKARENEFSKIKDRFPTRLSLSSSAADEVIQKRLLSKKDSANAELDSIYSSKAADMKNLFHFEGAMSDLKGYAGALEFARDFPFVPYQYILMQRIYTEVRRHGIVGASSSNAARSMLGGFHDAALSVLEKDEYTLVPLDVFYDSLSKDLSNLIRDVITRCQKAADNGDGIEPFDVRVLKLLFLIRYVDNEIKSNLENIVILMADDIRMDKIEMRKTVQASLDRLYSQNYIGKSGDTWHFLTDEEQDILIAIKNTSVSTADIVSKIATLIFGDIYTTKKFHQGRYDFPFDQMVDGQVVGSLTGGMTLRMLTVAADDSEKNKLYLLSQSSGQVIALLAENTYYDSLEYVLKIRKYVKQKNINELPKTIRDIIKNYQDEATRLESDATESLKQSIVDAAFYVDGEQIEIKTGDAKSKLDQALSYLVSSVYKQLDLIEKFSDSDSDLLTILKGDQISMDGMAPNTEAAAQVYKYLEVQKEMHLPTTMADVQEKFQKKPFGWREIDVAAVMALLIQQQKVTIRYGGETIRSDNTKLPDMLRKKSEIGKTSVSLKVSPDSGKLIKARSFLRSYFNEMDIPEDEEGFIRYIIEKFTDLQNHYSLLDSRYTAHTYPDRARVQDAIALVKDILSQKKDDIALIDRLLKKQVDLLDTQEDLQHIEEFFKTQVSLFDSAVQYEQELRVDMDFISADEAANKALNQIRLITTIQPGFKFRYNRIPELNELLKTVQTSHGQMLDAKRRELNALVEQCLGEIHTLAGTNADAKKASDIADTYYNQKKQQIATFPTLTLLDGLVQQILTYKDNTVAKINSLLQPVVYTEPVEGTLPGMNQHGVVLTPPGSAPKPKKLKTIYRQVDFPVQLLQSESDVDAYVAAVKKKLMQELSDCDGIRVN